MEGWVRSFHHPKADLTVATSITLPSAGWILSTTPPVDRPIKYLPLSGVGLSSLNSFLLGD